MRRVPGGSLHSLPHRIAQKRRQFRSETVHVFWTDLALPSDEHFPSRSLQSSDVSSIARGVAAKFCKPILLSRRRNSTAAAVVHVPEATVNNDDPSESSKDQVGATRQRGIVKAVAESHGMYEATDEHLGLGVLGFHRGHHAGAFGLVEILGSNNFALLLPSLSMETRSPPR